MTQDERDVIEAAKAAVTIEDGDRIVVADISKDPERIGALVRTVVRLRFRDQEAKDRRALRKVEFK
jgi:hypothetical protein